MKKKSQMIIVDRTSLNVRISALSVQNDADNEIYALTKVMKRVSAEEKKANKPIMNIAMDISEAALIFSEKEVEEKFLCLV